MKSAYTIRAKAARKASKEAQKAFFRDLRQGILDEQARKADPNRPMTDAEKLYQEFKEFVEKQKEKAKNEKAE